MSWNAIQDLGELIMVYESGSCFRTHFFFFFFFVDDASSTMRDLIGGRGGGEEEEDRVCVCFCPIYLFYLFLSEFLATFPLIFALRSPPPPRTSLEVVEWPSEVSKLIFVASREHRNPLPPPYETHGAPSIIHSSYYHHHYHHYHYLCVLAINEGERESERLSSWQKTASFAEH